jgi:hypothetical protein
VAQARKSVAATVVRLARDGAFELPSAARADAA